MEEEILTEDKLSKFVLDSQYRTGMIYLSDALHSTKETIKVQNIEKAFDYLTKTVGIAVSERQKLSADVEKILVVSYWGRYIYYSLYDDYINMIRQVMGTIIVSPLFSILFFPPNYFLKEELKLPEFEREVIRFGLNRHIKNLNDITRHFGASYCPCNGCIGTLNLFDHLDDIDKLNSAMRDRARKLLDQMD